MMNVKKILFVGNEDHKNNFLNQIGVEIETHPLFKLGVNVSPVLFQGKKYTIWDAHVNSSDQNILMWGKNSDMVVVFGNDTTWFHRCVNLFPNTKIQMFQSNSPIMNLEP